MSAFPKHQDNIECRYRHQRQQHTRIGLLESELASGVRYRAPRGILQPNHHLSQRRWFESAPALEHRNKLFERKILWTDAARVVARTRRKTSRGLGSPLRLVRRITVLASGPMRCSVPGRLRLATSSHTQVIFTHVAMQQRFEGGDERHEQRAALFTAEAFGRLRQPCWQYHLPPRGAEAVDRPFPTRDAKLHHWQRIVELLTPVCQLRNDVPREIAARRAGESIPACVINARGRRSVKYLSSSERIPRLPPP